MVFDLHSRILQHKYFPPPTPLTQQGGETFAMYLGREQEAPLVPLCIREVGIDEQHLRQIGERRIVRHVLETLAVRQHRLEGLLRDNAFPCISLRLRSVLHVPVVVQVSEHVLQHLEEGGIFVQPRTMKHVSVVKVLGAKSGRILLSPSFSIGTSHLLCSLLNHIVRQAFRQLLYAILHYAKATRFP